MLSKFRYYTGIIFQAYTYGTGEPLIKGGRYNELMKHFGKPASSIGFAIVVDNLMLALSRQKLTVPSGDKTIVITYDPGNLKKRSRKQWSFEIKVKKWHCARQRRSRTDEISYICPHKRASGQQNTGYV